MAATKTLNQANFEAIEMVEVTGDTGALHVIVDSGTVTSGSPTSTTGAATSVAANVSSVQLLAANTNRKSASVFNDADKALYLKYGTAASATSYKVKIAAGGYFEFPDPIYTGVVHGIWEASPTGSARISEET